MCDKNVFKAPFMVKYCPDKCNNQEMCEKAVFLSDNMIGLLKRKCLKHLIILYFLMLIYCRF